MKNNKKAFVSSSSDRGIFVKVLKDKISLSFWGNDDPKNISYSSEEAEELCKYILTKIDEKKNERGGGNTMMFNEVCEEMISRIPPRQKL